MCNSQEQKKAKELGPNAQVNENPDPTPGQGGDLAIYHPLHGEALDAFRNTVKLPHGGGA